MPKPRPVFQAEQPAYRLTHKQDEFCRLAAPVSLYRGGIASGKTVAGVTKSVIRRYQYPGTWQLIAGPSWDQVRDGTMATLRRLLHPKCILYENKVEHVMGLDNGSGFIFRTLTDPDVLRSLEFHDEYIDEIAMCSEESFDIALGRMRLRYTGETPVVNGVPQPFQNQLWGTTTPRATDWTLDVFGLEGKDGYGVVHSTIYDNRANLPDGYIERLEAKYRDTPFFEQELLGQYTAFEGLVYPMFMREKHVKHDPWPLDMSERVAVGVDFGGTADPSAMVLIGERNNRFHQFAEFYKVGATLDEMLAQLDLWTSNSRRTREQVLVRTDPNGTVLTTTISAAKYACMPAARDKTAGLKLVAQRLTGLAGTPQFTISPSCIYTITEFGHYVWSSRKDGSTSVVYFTKTPIDHHCDALDGIRYGLLGLGQAITYRPVRISGGLVVRGR